MLLEDELSLMIEIGMALLEGGIQVIEMPTKLFDLGALSEEIVDLKGH